MEAEIIISTNRVNNPSRVVFLSLTKSSTEDQTFEEYSHDACAE
jgi:hypothetical protein